MLGLGTSIVSKSVEIKASFACFFTLGTKVPKVKLLVFHVIREVVDRVELNFVDRVEIKLELSGYC